MPAHGFAEPETPPPDGRALGALPDTPPVTPTSTPPRFSLEGSSLSPASSIGPSAADVEVPPMPDVAAAMWTDVLGAELTCCGRRLGLQKAKRVLSVVSAAAVVLAATVLVVTVFAMREADEVEQASAGQAVVVPAASGGPCAPNPCVNGGKVRLTSPPVTSAYSLSVLMLRSAKCPRWTPPHMSARAERDSWATNVSLISTRADPPPA